MSDDDDQDDALLEEQHYRHIHAVIRDDDLDDRQKPVPPQAGKIQRYPGPTSDLKWR